MTRSEIESRPVGIRRRDLLRYAGLGVLGYSASGWFPVMAQQLAGDPRRTRHCILLWMSGGPSQTDTFDMKPGHANGGEFKEVASKVPGLRMSEHLPQLAAQADRLAVLRGVSTKEGDHGRATFLMRTGHPPGGEIRYPTLGALLSKELGSDAELPNYVSIAPYQNFNPAAFSPGFLGPRYAPATVRAGDDGDGGDPQGYARLGVDYLGLPRGVAAERMGERVALWKSLQDRFLATHRGGASEAQDTVYRRAVRVLLGDAKAAFDLSGEADTVREAYGRGRFGQGCLIARRLVERGVPFVEVSLGDFSGGAAGWDTHQNNFPAVRNLSQQLDTGWAALMRDLAERGLLDTTTIVWMGEFGRTPKINTNAGRDHFPNAWSCVLAGGGIQGGQAFGSTGPDGMEVTDGKVGVGDLLATICQALGIDPDSENVSEIGRPIRIAEGSPVSDVLA